MVPTHADALLACSTGGCPAHGLPGHHAAPARLPAPASPLWLLQRPATHNIGLLGYPMLTYRAFNPNQTGACCMKLLAAKCPKAS